MITTRPLLFQICLCLIAIFLTCHGWRPYKIELTNITSFSSSDICQMNSSISSAGSISLFMNADRSVPNFYAKTVIKIARSNSTYDLVLVNKTVDGCQFLENPRYEPIIQAFYRELKRPGTFPKRCPIAKKLYFVKDLLVDTEKLPPTVPYIGRVVVAVTLMTKIGNTSKVLCGFKIKMKIERTS